MMYNLFQYLSKLSMVLYKLNDIALLLYLDNNLNCILYRLCCYYRHNSYWDIGNKCFMLSLGTYLDNIMCSLWWLFGIYGSLENMELCICFSLGNFENNIMYSLYYWNINNNIVHMISIQKLLYWMSSGINSYHYNMMYSLMKYLSKFYIHLYSSVYNMNYKIQYNLVDNLKHKNYTNLH